MHTLVQYICNIEIFNWLTFVFGISSIIAKVHSTLRATWQDAAFVFVVLLGHCAPWRRSIVADNQHV